MTITNETYARLAEVTHGVLSKSMIQGLQIPDSTEERQLEYIAARIQPVMGQYRYPITDLLLLAIEQHFAQNKNATAKVSARSNRAIEALMLNDTEKRGASVNPWTYGATNGKAKTT